MGADRSGADAGELFSDPVAGGSAHMPADQPGAVVTRVYGGTPWTRPAKIARQEAEMRARLAKNRFKVPGFLRQAIRYYADIEATRASNRERSRRAREKKGGSVEHCA